KNNPPSCSIVYNYFQRSHARLSSELCISNEHRLDGYIQSIEQCLSNEREDVRLLALNRSESLMSVLLERVKVQSAIEFLRCIAKIIELASTMLDTAVRAFTFSIPVLPISVTIIKMTSYIYRKHMNEGNLNLLKDGYALQASNNDGITNAK